MLFQKELVIFGPREVLLTSSEPVVEQFLNGRRLGPIGMSEEKDQAQLAVEQAQADVDQGVVSTEDVRGVVPQLRPTPGLPPRAGAQRRKDRVMRVLNTLPVAAREGIVGSLTLEEQQHYGVRARVRQDQL
jgi:phospholipid/cholesterol/gamma-HCH transport system ATP-binding protein